MPGMAANPSIFDKIDLPGETFEKHFLDWTVPDKNISLEDYALKMSRLVKHDDAVLIGVSFGGILVQEMAKHIKVAKVIIISSVKSNLELPKRMIFAKYTKVHKLLPTGLVNNMELLAKYAFGETVPKRLNTYPQLFCNKAVVFNIFEVEIGKTAWTTKELNLSTQCSKEYWKV